MFTTADLPADMQFNPEPQALAVRGSGLTVTCRHGDPHCPTCITRAARALVDAQRTDH